MTTFLLAVLLPLWGAPLVLDSAGRRQPAIHLVEVAPSWAPSVLRDRLVLEVGEGPGADAARAALARAAATYGGDWKSDFARFRSRWLRSLADNSWSVEVAAFWRTRADEELPSRSGLQGPAAASELQEWVRWMESADPRVRWDLADLTSRELSTPGVLSPTDIDVGGIVTLDLSRSRFDGPVRVRVERLVRKGLSFLETRGFGPVQTWKPPAAKPVWSSRSWPEPGLFRIVWEAKGFYQQAFVRVGGLEPIAFPTDSGMLVWAGPSGGGASRIVWMGRRGKVDSLAVDLSVPLHIGFPPASDSGLVALVSGNAFATLRLHRPAPDLQERLGLTEERDRHGLPLLVPPRRQGRSGWTAASLLERDAYEKGEWLRVSGWMRHLDPYGRPDSLRGDSLEWSVEPFSGAPTRRWAKPDASGWWTDSAKVELKGRVHVTALAAEGRLLKEEFCETGTLYRVRDAERSCLEIGDAEAPLPAAPDTLWLDLRRKSDLPALAVLTQGRALDWRLATGDSALLPRIPKTPALAGGASILLAAPSASGGWTGWRQSLEQELACSQRRFPLAVETDLPAKPRKGSPLPSLRVVARTGPVPSLKVSVRLVPDGYAAPLQPLCRILDRSWAVSEVYTGEAAWKPLGLGEPDFQSYGRRRDPDPFARIGVRSLPPLCIACGPWTGSWKTQPGDASLPSGCGWTSPDRPCEHAGTIPVLRFSVREARVDSTGELRTGLAWPETPGSWRLQAWGIDSLGRVLAWERTVGIE